MSLKIKIEEDIKDAIRSKDQTQLTALRAIKSMILIAETEKGSEGVLSKEAEIKLLMKAVKQRKDSAEIYKSQGREDLQIKEEQEIAVIKRYLPQQMSEDELKQELQSIINKTGANGMQDMGKVMGIATKELAGKADGKAISIVVKNLLSKS